MGAALEVISLNVQVLQAGAFIWMVFEVRLLRHIHEQHMTTYHGQKRRSSDGQNDEPTI